MQFRERARWKRNEKKHECKNKSRRKIYCRDSSDGRGRSKGGSEKLKASAEQMRNGRAIRASGNRELGVLDCGSSGGPEGRRHVAAMK